MKCPICGSRLYPGADRCQECGCHIRNSHADFPEFHPRRSRKKRVSPMLILLSLLPVLMILAAVSALPFIFGSIAHEEVVPEPDRIVTIPVDQEPISLPQADEGCFAITGGDVTFLPDRWDGSTIVHVPETVNGHPVTGLADGCFAGCDGLTTIVLPDTIIRIGADAFAGCTRLRGLYLPEGTKTIGENAFAGCLDLDAVYVPDSVESIGSGCFSDCPGLLYIFCNVTFETWNGLYSEFITPFTVAICLDGSFYHGTGR